jgi:hypothetical protein
MTTFQVNEQNDYKTRFISFLPLNVTSTSSFCLISTYYLSVKTFLLLSFISACILPKFWSPLKGEARRFSDKSARSQSCEKHVPFKLQRHLLQLLAISKVVANCAHSSICIPFLHPTVTVLAMAL